MEKIYIGTIELNNGSVVVGDALSPDSTIEICPIYKGAYHCYWYVNNMGRTHVGIEYGGTLETPEFQEAGFINVGKSCGIFESVYYKVNHKEDLSKKWEEKVKGDIIENISFTTHDNRAVFINTFNEENQEAYVFKQVDSKNFCVGIEISYIEGTCKAESAQEVIPDKSCVEYDDDEELNEIEPYTDACINDPEENCLSVSCAEEDCLSVSCAECAQNFFTEAEDVVIEETKEQPITDDKYEVKKLYYSLNGTRMAEIVIPKMNEILKELIGEIPPLYWYRGITIEKLDGKIHKLTIDFD